MFYSNEVILMNTSTARYVDPNDDDCAYNVHNNAIDRNKAVPGNELYSFKSRMFKILEVVKYDDDYLEKTPNPIGVLIQNVFDKDIYILCKATDLLYMHDSLTTFKYNRRTNWYDVFIPVSMGENKSRFNDYYDVAEMLSTITPFHTKSIHKKLQDAEELVDKTDVRLHNLDNYCRFHIKGGKNSIRVIKQIIKMTGSRFVSYKECDVCNNLDVSYRKFEPYENVCFYCFTSTNCSCDVCLDDKTMKDITTIESLKSSRNQYLHSIFKDSGVKKCCNGCTDNFHISCKKCRKIEYIDFEELRGTTYKGELYDKFKNNNKDYSRVFSSTYCNNCASIMLTQYLHSPFKARELPNEFASKNEFNRFVGIESEVITHYDDADYYSQEAMIPDYFDVVDDGSLSSGGVEFRTSRPIIGDKIDIALNSLEEVNRDEDNYVDSSCGVHIHMNALDFNFIEIKSLLMIMTRIQPLLYLSLPNDREKNYCREIKWSMKELKEIDNLSQLVSRYYKLQDSTFSDEKYNDARYTGTNIHARFLLGSIEFRYHEGTTYSGDIRNWIKFINRIMSKSTKLSRDNNLYNKIISNKTDAMDIVRGVTGLSGVDYLENKIHNNQ
jgi:hypothetical protein